MNGEHINELAAKIIKVRQDMIKLRHDEHTLLEQLKAIVVKDPMCINIINVFDPNDFVRMRNEMH